MKRRVSLGILLRNFTNNFLCSIGNIRCGILGVVHCRVNARFILFQKVFEEGIVQEFGPLGLWKHGPQQKCELECIIEWNPVKKNVNKSLKNTEKGKDNPVNQPLHIISLCFRFDSLERLEGWVQESNQRRQGCDSNTKNHNQGQESTSSANNHFFGNFSLILKDSKSKNVR